MSLQGILLSYISSPKVVTVAGVSVLAGMPYICDIVLTGGGVSLTTLQLINITAFAANVISVSIPGRIDGKEDDDMRSRASAALIPKAGGSTTSTSGTTEYGATPNVSSDGSANNDYSTLYSPERGRTLVVPSGWAFSIWGPIYLGEAIFCCYGQFVDPALTANLALITGPFTAACIFQSLWCASFRPSYYAPSPYHWTKFVSVGMLAGTAYSLSQITTASSIVNGDLAYYLIPLTMHFGWTTAATLVNLNGSIGAIGNDVSDEFVIGTGHTSALIATGLGCYVTLAYLSPVYGLTIAWALAACKTGISAKKKKKQQQPQLSSSDSKLIRACAVQERLCQFGSVACIAASAYVAFLA